MVRGGGSFAIYSRTGGCAFYDTLTASLGVWGVRLRLVIDVLCMLSEF